MTVSLTLLSATDQQGRALFKLNQPYEYQLGPGSTITVPAGYVTNFGTVPRWFAWIVSPAQLREAAIVHDWLCNEDQTDDGQPVDSGYSRWIADAVIYEAMARMGFGVCKRTLVYYGVRFGAWMSKPKWPDPPNKMKVMK